jgi:CBS-domain-containing membrane protein
MSERQVRRVPIVNGQGAVIGIVAQADLARASAKETELEHEMAETIEDVSEPAHLARPR